ncbi:MAG: right-handed parallel beta-helix repeat-containing protein, partial [Chloroflexi bacterium]|nr:right-handed parallel beta-helix repeat-containing protein [Chloroflexota bacterium]
MDANSTWKRALGVCLFFALLFGAALPLRTVQALGVNFYVSPAGNNANDCLSLATACLTIQAAIDKAGAGDIVNVAAGTYPEQIRIAKALTVTGEDGAILDGASLTAVWTTGVKIKSGNVTFNNIDVTNFTQDGIIIGYEASIPGSLQNVQVTNSTISNIQPGYWGFGIYAGYEAEAFKYTPPKLTTHLDYSGLLIENNEIINTASAALVLQSITGTPGTLIVRHNVIHANVTNAAVWIDSARNIQVVDNVVADNGWGFYISSYGDAFQYPWVYDWTYQQLNGPYGPADLLISGNIIQNTIYDGVILAAGYPSTIFINENSITGNSPGFSNYLTETVDATLNWWG